MGMPEGWRTHRLAQVAEIQTGVAKNKASVADPVSLPYLRVANVQDGYLKLDDMKTITVDASKVERYRVWPGDVLLTEGGDFDKLGRGTVWRGELELCLHQNHVFAVRVNKEIVTPDFLSALTSSAYGKRYFLDSSKQTTNLASINTAQLREFPVLLPPLGEQRKIAAILSSVDEAIEKTQAVIDQVQVVKKGLMQELLTRGLPGRHKKFKQTEIGEIPASWEVVTLGTVLERIEAGWSPQCESHPPEDGEWGVLKVSAVSGGHYRAEESKKYIGSAPRPEIEVCIGDVLLARASGVLELVGKTVLVDQTPGMLMLSDKTLRLRPMPTRMTNRFLHNIMSHSPVREQLLNNTGGSHMRNVSQAAIRRLVIPLPPLEEQANIDSSEHTISLRHGYETKFATALTELKQALMSTLLTGELRVTP